MQQPLMFKLDQNPRGRGLRCDSDGLFLGHEALLCRDAHGDFEARPVGELHEVLGRTYGDEASWESRIRSVMLVAAALNKGDMARAMMTAVLMRLPDPGGPIRIVEVDSVLAKAGFNPDEPRDEHGRWTSGASNTSTGSVRIEDHASADERNSTVVTSTERRPFGVQVADAAMSDAVNDPLVEAARRAAALAAQHSVNPTSSRAKAVSNTHEDFWQALGSKLSDRAKALLTQIGNAELLQSRANLAATQAEANAVRNALSAYGNYGMQPWYQSNGERAQVSVINTGSEASDAGAVISHFLLEPNEPLARPAINAD